MDIQSLRIIRLIKKKEQKEWKNVDSFSKKVIRFVHTNIAPSKLHFIITKVAHNRCLTGRTSLSRVY